MKKLSVLLSIALAATLVAASAVAQDTKPAAPEKKSETKMIKTASGLQYEDTKVGTGASCAHCFDQDIT